MSTLPIRAGAIAALVLAATQAQAGAQLTFDAQVSPMVTGTLALSDPPARFAVRRQAAAPLVVENGEFARTLGVGVNAGVRIADNFGLEGMFWWLPAELSAEQGLQSYDGNVDTNSMVYGVTAAYYIPRIEWFEGFVGIGVGGETMMFDPELAWERQTDFMTNAVIGAQLWLSEQLAVRVEGRDYLTRFRTDVPGESDTNEHELTFSAGLTFRSPMGR